MFGSRGEIVWVDKGVLCGMIWCCVGLFYWCECVGGGENFFRFEMGFVVGVYMCEVDDFVGIDDENGWMW